MKTLEFGAGLGKRRRVGGNWGQSDNALALRRAVARLGGKFTNAQLLTSLQAHESAEKVLQWVNNGSLGSQVTKWREAGEIELVEAQKRVFQTTALWKGGVK